MASVEWSQGWAFRTPPVQPSVTPKCLDMTCLEKSPVGDGRTVGHRLNGHAVQGRVCPLVEVYVLVGKVDSKQTDVWMFWAVTSAVKKSEAGEGQSGRWQEGCFTRSVRHGLPEDCHLCRDLKEQMSEPSLRSRGSIFHAEGAQANVTRIGGSTASLSTSKAGSVAGVCEQVQRVCVCVCVCVCIRLGSPETQNQ